jgi:murein DD-endopeptidase MepM/ murein hydrolase activator NlpD
MITWTGKRIAPMMFALVVVLHASSRELGPETVLTWQPPKLVRGSPLLFRVSAPVDTQSISARWLGHEIKFFHPTGKRLWYALAGVPVETPAGSYDLSLTEVLPGGPAEFVRKVQIAAVTYPKVTVRVAKQYTEPSPEQLKQIAADKSLKQKIFATQIPSRLWSGEFHAPVSAAISDVFGTERVFNGEVQSRHLGLDYAVPAGTPVRAVNRGTVILALPLYFEGDCVVIDHGQGLLSLYLHLSEFRAKEGETVDAGRVIGLSGGSGRATGPHLHLAIRWQGIYLSPAILLGLKLPN